MKFEDIPKDQITPADLVERGRQVAQDHNRKMQQIYIDLRLRKSEQEKKK